MGIRLDLSGSLVGVASSSPKRYSWIMQKHALVVIAGVAAGVAVVGLGASQLRTCL